MTVTEGKVAAVLTATILTAVAVFGSFWLIDVYSITDSVSGENMYGVGLTFGSLFTSATIYICVSVSERVEEWIATDAVEVVSDD